MAIIATSDGNVGLFCSEAPSPYFFDVIQIMTNTAINLCKTFLQTIDAATLLVWSAVPEVPVLIGAKISGDVLSVESPSDPCMATVIVGAVRRGRTSVRFPKFTDLQMRQNANFWDNSHQ